MISECDRNSNQKLLCDKSWKENVLNNNSSQIRTLPSPRWPHLLRQTPCRPVPSTLSQRCSNGQGRWSFHIMGLVFTTHSMLPYPWVIWSVAEHTYRWWNKVWKGWFHKFFKMAHFSTRSEVNKFVVPREKGRAKSSQKYIYICNSTHWYTAQIWSKNSRCT